MSLKESRSKRGHLSLILNNQQDSLLCYYCYYNEHENNKNIKYPESSDKAAAYIQPILDPSLHRASNAVILKNLLHI